MATWLASAILLIAQATPPQQLRIIPFVALTPAGDIELRIDNPSPEPLDAVLVVELVLGQHRSMPPSDTPSPVASYRARLDCAEAVVRPSEGETRIYVAANGSRKWLTSVTRLRWYEYLSATPLAPGPFRQVVPPGDYWLALRISKGESPWWHSEQLTVATDGRGHLTLRANEGQ